VNEHEVKLTKHEEKLVRFLHRDEDDDRQLHHDVFSHVDKKKLGVNEADSFRGQNRLAGSAASPGAQRRVTGSPTRRTVA
jgi:hypothetical protein